MKKKLFKVIILVVMAACFSYLINRYTLNRAVYVDKNIENINFSDVPNLMIVAHPDDDYIWGGSHLIDDDYLVVCVTCGTKRKRVIEFKKAMNKTNDKYMMLGYPDKTNGERDNWNEVYDDIYEELENIINYKDWNIVVTHNPEGEYGHIHHKMINKMVTDITNHDKLWYFGKYYSKGNIPSDLERISDENYTKKVNELIPIYKSQKSSMDIFGHMFAYEKWVTYEEWFK